MRPLAGERLNGLHGLAQKPPRDDAMRQPMARSYGWSAMNGTPTAIIDLTLQWAGSEGRQVSMAPSLLPGGVGCVADLESRRDKAPILGKVGR